MPIPVPADGPPPRPTSLLTHVLLVDDLVSSGSLSAESDVSTLNGAAAGAAIAPVPWQSGGPWAVTNDTDLDGVPDAFDHFFGPGAYPPGT